jgi:hypothetical protein
LICSTLIARNKIGGKLKAQREEAAMRPSEVLPQHRETIRQLVLEAGMKNPRVFGSVLHGDDEDGSDLDLLVDPAPRASLLMMVRLQSQLEQATGIKIDLRTPAELHSRIRCKVLSEAASL